MVTLQPVAAKPGVAVTPPWRVPTALDGSFVFKQLVPATYGLCAQIPGEQVRRLDEPFLDGCQWVPLQNVHVSAGQGVSGVRIVAPTGTTLRVRVNDPGSVLPKVKNPAPLDPLLRLMIKTQNHSAYPVPMVSQDAAGRNYVVVVPHDAPISLSASSSQAKLDVAGQQIQTDIAMQVPKGSTPGPVNINVHR